METFRSVHASDVDPATLERLLAEYAEYEESRVFRRLVLTRLSLIAVAVWFLSWRVHLLPHVALWVALAMVAFAAFFTSPTPPAIPGRPAIRR